MTERYAINLHVWVLLFFLTLDRGALVHLRVAKRLEKLATEMLLNVPC
jgi:hypothetical protein